MSWLGIAAVAWATLVLPGATRDASEDRALVLVAKRAHQDVLPAPDPWPSSWWKTTSLEDRSPGLASFELLPLHQPLPKVVFTAAMAMPRTLMRGVRVAGRDAGSERASYRVRLRPWVSRGGVRLHVEF